MSSNLEDTANGSSGEGEQVSIQDALSMAVDLQRDGRIPEAAYIYLQILAAVPDHIDALHLLGVAEHQVGRPELALKHISRALELAPDHADALSNRGNVHRSLRQMDEAEADYRRALVLRPQDPNTLNNLGSLLRARGDLEDAVATFREVIAVQPDHSAAWQNLGGTLQNLQRGAESLAAFREAARLAPESPDMYRDMGGALYFEGRYHDAAEMYRRCLALSPDDARAKHMLAACGVGDVPARASDAFVRALFDGYAPTFEASLARLDYRGPELVSEAVEAIAGDVPAQASVLDAGCGTGLCGPLLRPRAGRLVGVDLSSGMVALARDRAVYDELVVEELTSHLGAHNRSYDIIASADTFEYFGDLREVLAAAASAMRSRGALVFTVERAGPEEAKPGYRLNPHGRYSHTRAYVAETLGQVGLLAVDIREVQLRKELHQWVAGYLVCARGPVLP